MYGRGGGDLACDEGHVLLEHQRLAGAGGTVGVDVGQRAAGPHLAAEADVQVLAARLGRRGAGALYREGPTRDDLGRLMGTGVGARGDAGAGWTSADRAARRCRLFVDFPRGISGKLLVYRALAEREIVCIYTVTEGWTVPCFSCI